MATLCNSCELQESCQTAQNNNIKITDCGRYFQTRRETVRVKQTNADHIRSMSDEELMQFCVGLKTYEGCPNHGLIDCQESCGKCWLEWLKGEAE